jgi:methylmalonyl-CoA/ethylmalonyl-CoA epimerase
MENQFKKLLQIGIIVPDVEAAAKNFEENYGMGPWKFGQIGPQGFPKMQVDGIPGTSVEFKMAFCHCYGLEFELIQPVSESAYSKWLAEHGPGIHHIAVMTRDSFQDVIAQHKTLTGKDPWIWVKDTGAPEGRNMEFAYLDLVKELGLFVEVYPEHVQKHHESNIGGHEA